MINLRFDHLFMIHKVITHVLINTFIHYCSNKCRPLLNRWACIACWVRSRRFWVRSVHRWDSSRNEVCREHLGLHGDSTCPKQQQLKLNDYSNNIIRLGIASVTQYFTTINRHFLVHGSYFNETKMK